ncbi:hypothetical protein T265_07337 [Opisthorchis viverrini]|uniref:Uncharacterized protein n=1 Tax=Opisthorchis viverrini TaxID=6198 RepID=A0A074ZDD9_OPIVI|nr:hypothetical protein T265_07337 [Opisthorchis viverrini]KER25178.1 hypothetical protein T265_07337 [Opisthorchis viverrini]
MLTELHLYAARIDTTEHLFPPQKRIQAIQHMAPSLVCDCRVRNQQTAKLVLCPQKNVSKTNESFRCQSQVCTYLLRYDVEGERVCRSSTTFV